MTPISSAIEVAVKFSGAGVFFLFVSIAVLIWRRTRSAHMIWSRLWRIFNGKNECPVPAVKRVLDGQHALMQFRFTTGVRARTLAQMRRAVNFARRNGENIGDIGGCGWYFDYDRPGLKSDSKALLLPVHLSMSIVTAVLATASLLFIFGIFLNKPLYVFDKTGTWFVLSEVRAAPLLNGGKGFRIADCTARPPELIKTSGFTEAEIAEICSAMQKPETGKTMFDLVVEQRISFGLFALSAVWFFVPMFNLTVQTGRAREMQKRIERRYT